VASPNTLNTPRSGRISAICVPRGLVFMNNPG
jgi:hypothetical protein